MVSYDDSTKKLQQQLLEMLKPIYESQRKLFEAAATTRNLQKEIFQMLNDQSQFIKEYKASWMKLANTFSPLLSNFEKYTLDSFTPCFSDSISKINWDILQSSDSSPEDDYVTFDDNIVKTFNIPDDVIIPIGHHRIRMKTELFLTFIGSIFLPLLFAISGFLVDLSNSAAESKNIQKQFENEEKIIQLEEQQNQLFQQYIDLLESVDASHTSQTDTIESLKLLSPAFHSSLPDNQ